MDLSHLFPSLPDDARCWIYVADRPLTDDEQRRLLDRLRAFLQDWTSHGRPVEGAVEVLDDRFIALAAMLSEGEISGCGIDDSVRAVDEAAQALGIEWVPALDVLYRDEAGRVQHHARSAFRTLVQEGTVTAATRVFDPSITTLADLREGRFERPAGTSWHARAFDLATAAS